MNTPIRGRHAIAAALLVPALAACGFHVQTDQVYQPAVGVSDQDGSVDVINTLVVSGADGSGTLVATLVNKDSETADQLVSVTGSAITAQGGPIAVAAGSAVNLARDGAIAVSGDDVVPGRFVELTFTFANGQATELRAPVVRATNEFADVPLPSTEADQAAAEEAAQAAEEKAAADQAGDDQAAAESGS